MLLSGISTVRRERGLRDLHPPASPDHPKSLLGPEGFGHQVQLPLMLAPNQHLALSGFQHQGNMNVEQCYLPSFPSLCPCPGHALCLLTVWTSAASRAANANKDLTK